MISSAANMSFWLHLCQATNLPGAAQVIQPFVEAAAKGKECLEEYCLQYNTDLLKKVSLCSKPAL